MEKGTKTQKDSNTGASEETVLTPPLPKEPVVKETKKKMVEVEEDVLKKILDKQDTQDAENKKLRQDIEILRETADKGRLSRADQARADGKIVKVVRLSKVGDLYVVGWKSIKDEVYTDERGVIHADQQVEYFFNDKTSKVLTLVYFSRNSKMENCEVVAEKKDKDGRMSYDVLTAKGLELSVGITFVN